MQTFGSVVAAVCHHTVDDAVCGVFACFNGHLAQLKTDGLQCDVEFLGSGNKVDMLGLKSDVRKSDLGEGGRRNHFVFSVDVRHAAELSIVDHHIDKSKRLAVGGIDDLAPDGVLLCPARCQEQE